MKRRSFIKYLGLTTLVTGGTVACDMFQRGNNSPQVLKIASILTLSGPAAIIGQEILAGQKLAIDYWNSKGKLKIDFTSQDSENQPPKGLSAYQSLKAQGYNIFIANGSGVAVAIKPEINGEQQTFLALAAHPKITDPVQTGVFRYSNTASGEATTLTDWIKKNKPTKNIVVIHSADDYGFAFAEAVKANFTNGETVITTEYRPEDAANMRNIVQSKLPKDDYIPIVVGVGQPMAQAMTVLRTLGYQGAILANIGYALTGVAKILGKDAGRVVYLTLDVPQNSHTQWATEQYKKTHQKDITPDALIGFYSVSLITVTAQSLAKIEVPAINNSLLTQAQQFLASESPYTNNEIIIKVKTNES